MAKIYIVCQCCYDYDSADYERCLTLNGTSNIGAFTLEELAEEYCQELTIKFFRENDISLDHYSPYEGGYSMTKVFDEVLEKVGLYKKEKPFTRFLPASVWGERSDQEVWEAAKMLSEVLVFFCVQEIKLYA